MVGCREDVVDAAVRIVKRKGRNEFTPSEVVQEMQKRGTPYAESTIRTHVVSRCCSNAPRHHGTKYDDLERIGSGLYRIVSLD